MNFFIRSDEQSYDKKLPHMEGLIYLKPQYFIIPGDTFFVSMVINRYYGETVSNDSRFFSNSGYFKPGNYKIYAEDIFGDVILKTNEIAFNVLELNEEDKKVLELIHNKKYDEVFNNYPFNTFTEHAYSEYCTERLYLMETGNNNTDSINTAFFNFINKYPNSLYNINIGFVNSYFTKITYKTSDVNDALNNIKTKTEGSLFDKFIENRPIKEELIKNYNELKSMFNKQNLDSK